MWDEVAGTYNRIKMFCKLLQPGSRRMPFCFMVWAALAKKCWPCILQNVFMQVCGKKALRYLRELPPDGY